MGYIALHVTRDGFLSAATVVTILAAVALLAVASALVLAPLNMTSRRSSVAFAFCLLATWVVASFIIALIRNTL